ncbi:hypothetical protein ACLOJK_003693 [Asimina triloba]
MAPPQQPEQESLLPKRTIESSSGEDEETAYSSSEKIVVVGSDDDDLAGGSDPSAVPPFSWKKLWLFTGPGFLMSIAFLDPGNLEGDLQAGAIAGYSLLWILMWATIMGLLIQILSARLGVATGRHLAELCRDEYPAWAKYVLWVMAEVALIGADIQEVIGSAIAIKILSNGALPLWAGVVITAFDCFIFLFLENYGVRKLEAVFAVLIAVMALSFAWMFGETKPSGTELLIDLSRSTADLVSYQSGILVPKLSSRTIRQAVGVVGCIIMPHNVFLHSALVQSRKIDTKKEGRVREAINYYSIESMIALIVSFIINVFVTTVFAKGFYGSEVAKRIGLVNAGQYLQEKYGGGIFPILYIWAIGLLAAGQSSTITGTYAGQFIMGGFLNLRLKKWLRALITRSFAIVPTMIVALVFDTSEAALDVLNEWLNVLQSIQIPFALIPLLYLVSKEQIVGVFKIGSALKTVAWIVAVFVMAINGYLMVDFFSAEVKGPWFSSFVCIVTAAYVLFILYLILHGGLANWFGRALPKRFTNLIPNMNGKTSAARPHQPCLLSLRPLQANTIWTPCEEKGPQLGFFLAEDGKARGSDQMKRKKSFVHACVEGCMVDFLVQCRPLRSLTLWDVVSGEKISRVTLQHVTLHARLRPGSSASSTCLACPLSSAPVLVDLNTGTTIVLPVSPTDAPNGTVPQSRNKFADGSPAFTVNAATFNEYGDLIYIGDANGEILVTDSKNIHVAAMVPASGAALSSQNGAAQALGQISGESEWVVGASANKGEHQIYIWDRDGHLVKFLEGPKEALSDLAWHPVHPILVSLSMMGIWAKDYAENWCAFAPDFKEVEENEEYEEREKMEFDLMPDTEKVKEIQVKDSGINEDEEVDILRRLRKIQLSAIRMHRRKNFVSCLPFLLQMSLNSKTRL